MQFESPLRMNRPQKAGASSPHSKRCRAVLTFPRLAKRLECVRLADAFGSWSQCASDGWRSRLPTNRTLERRPPARLGVGSLPGNGRAGGRRSGPGAQSASEGRDILTPTLSTSEREREKISSRRTRSPVGGATLSARGDSLSPSDGERVRVRGAFSSIVEVKPYFRHERIRFRRQERQP